MGAEPEADVGDMRGDDSQKMTSEERPAGPTESLAPTFEAVYLESYARLVGLARTVLADADGDGAEEVVQEAFARWHDVRNTDDPLPYVRSAVLNLCRGRFRRKPTPLRPVEDYSSAEAEATLRARRRDVVGALRDLPLRQREVVALRYFGELSTDETAAELGISPGTVKTHLSRGIAALATALEEHRHD